MQVHLYHCTATDIEYNSVVLVWFLLYPKSWHLCSLIFKFFAWSHTYYLHPHFLEQHFWFLQNPSPHFCICFTPQFAVWVLAAKYIKVTFLKTAIYVSPRKFKWAIHHNYAFISALCLLWDHPAAKIPWCDCSPLTHNPSKHWRNSLNLQPEFPGSMKITRIHLGHNTVNQLSNPATHVLPITLQTLPLPVIF